MAFLLVQLCQLMVTFLVIESTQLRGSSDAEQFEDSVHRRYRFIVTDGYSSSHRAKSAAKSDDDLDTASVSDDVFVTSKPLYVYLYQIF